MLKRIKTIDTEGIVGGLTITNTSIVAVIKELTALSLTALLTLPLASCGSPSVPPPAQQLTPVRSTQPTESQLQVAQTRLAGLRSLSGTEADLNWNNAYVAEEKYVYVPTMDNKATMVVNINEPHNHIVKLESFRKDGVLYVKTSYAGTTVSHTDLIGDDGSVTEVSSTGDGSLKAQATCGELREEIQDLREAADSDDEAAFWFGAAGIVALEDPPVAAVAALASSRYRSKAIEKRNKANQLKNTYTKSCA